jgi:lipid-A-disaccharide synthase-like uncharacterized protein
MYKTDILVLTIGFAGQGCFFMRFFIQWLFTEKNKKSTIPISFWYFSLFGGILLLIYAIIRKDVVFTAGQAGGAFIYLRNLYFIHKDNKNEK